MNADRDAMEFSIMTYRSYINDPLQGGYSNQRWSYAQSPMMYDIRAIQQMYGANFSTNATDTTYTFSTVTGEMFVNGTSQGRPGENRIFRTIWDGNGIDTYSFSEYTTNLDIDLTPGGWVNLDRNNDFQRANLGDGKSAKGQVYNALQYNGDSRSLIENANGGSGNDWIFGNNANNKLVGNNGNDTLIGGTGNDSLIAGNGDDTADYSSATNGIKVNLDINTIDGLSGWLATDDGYGFRDTVEGVDRIIGSQFNDTVIGDNAWDNLLQGNNGNDLLKDNGGTDTLLGDGGNDTLIGGSGNDSLVGGFGADRFAFNNHYEGIDTIQDFAASQGDKIQIDVSSFGGGLTQGILAQNQFFIGSAAVSMSDRFIYNNGALFYDVDGNGSAAGFQIATLEGNASLSYNDFTLVA